MPGLLSPLQIKTLSLKNRIVMPPLALHQATADGEVTPQILAHYFRRLQGVAMIIVEHSYVARNGRFHAHQLGIHADELLPGLAGLAAGIKEAGVIAGIQITHAGAAASRATLGEQPAGPSAIRHPRSDSLPRSLATGEIDEIVEGFGHAAGRAVRAGFQFVEIHGAHGYLLNQFYSPLTNQRTDEYGGSRENRLRFPLRIVRRVREEVGPDFPVFYRLGGDDRTPGGLTVEDAVYAAPHLVEAGVDVLDLSGGMCGGRPEGLAPGYFVYLAEAVRPVVAVPLIVTGGIREPRLADSIIRSGVADLVGIGRALLADPDWAAGAVRELG